MKSDHVQVGVGVIVCRAGRVLLGLRTGSHGAGTWAFTGGHLEFGESPEACAARETFEETGLHITTTRRVAFSSNVFPTDGRHYVTLFIRAECETGEPSIFEPNKCIRWGWFDWSELPRPLFPPAASLVDSGFDPNLGT